jgi:CheY-like chemotaxis protein
MKTLVIVEDDDITRGLLAEIFSVYADWRTMMVEDGSILLQIIGVIKPDLVILDIVANRTDGLEAHRLLRMHPFGAAIPVLFITSNLVKADAAHLTGAHELIEKPFHVSVILDKVESLLALTDAGHSRV